MLNLVDEMQYARDKIHIICRAHFKPAWDRLRFKSESEREIEWEWDSKKKTARRVEENKKYLRPYCMSLKAECDMQKSS